MLLEIGNFISWINIKIVSSFSINYINKFFLFIFESQSGAMVAHQTSNLRVKGSSPLIDAF